MVKKSDFGQIIQLFTEFSEFEKRPDKMMNSVERLIKEKDFFNCMVAENQDKKIVGYVAYFFCFFTWTGKSIYMDDLYVKPEYRGENIGGTLLNKVIEIGKKNDCHKLRWQVANWNNPAIAFYKSIGAEIDDGEFDCDLNL